MFFMGFVFLAFLLVYLGLSFGYRPFLTARIAAIDADLEALAATDPTAGKQDEFLAFQAQLINLRNILSGRTDASNILQLIGSPPRTFSADAAHGAVLFVPADRRGSGARLDSCRLYS
mgnify:CR=1 FL=1